MVRFAAAARPCNERRHEAEHHENGQKTESACGFRDAARRSVEDLRTGEEQEQRDGGCNAEHTHEYGSRRHLLEIDVAP